MKYLLITLLSLLPFFGIAQDELDIGDTDSTQEIGYNTEFVDDLGEAMVNQDFSGLRKYMADTIGFHVESTDRVTFPTAEEVIEFFNYILQNTIPYSYEIEVMEVESEGILVYKLSYFVIITDEEGNPKLGVSIFAFAEKYGKIDVVLAP